MNGNKRMILALFLCVFLSGCSNPTSSNSTSTIDTTEQIVPSSIAETTQNQETTLSTTSVETEPQIEEIEQGTTIATSGSDIQTQEKIYTEPNVTIAPELPDQIPLETEEVFHEEMTDLN